MTDTRAAAKPARFARVAMHRPASRRPRGRRRRLPGRPDDLLLRRVRRRRVEDHRRRLDLAVHDRRPVHHGGRRRDRGCAVRPQRHLRRHRRSVHSQRRVARRRRLPIHRRRQDLDEHGIGRFAPYRAHRRPSAAIPISSMSRRSATPGDRTSSAAFSARRTAAATGSTSCSRANAPARTTSRSTRSIRTSSTRRSGRRSAIRTR